jgi:glycosyltransferase involved in cell wall biosynthesis
VDISVIICAKNAEKTIEACLRSVQEDKPAEIILIDGNSSDATLQISKKYTDQIYSDEGMGLASARQLGAQKAKSEYIAYVDSDVVLTPNCLQKMLEELQGKGYAGIHAQVLSRNNESYWEWAEDQNVRLTFNKVGEREWIGTIAAIFRRQSILENPFDLFFIGAGEDKALCLDLRNRGLRLGVSSVHIYHQHRASARGYIKQRIWYGKGAARLFWKYRRISYFIHPSLRIPFGIYVCCRKRSSKMLPYYIVGSVSSNIGLAIGLAQLVLQNLKTRSTNLKSRVVEH